MSIRGTIAQRAVGGPRFRPQPDKLLLELEGRSSLSEIAEKANVESRNVLNRSPVSNGVKKTVRDQLNTLGFKVKDLDNFGVLVAETNNLEKVMTSIIDARDTFKSESVDGVKNILNQAKSGNLVSFVGGFRPGVLNFSQPDKAELEAQLRNRLSSMSLHNPLTSALEDISGVVNVELNYTRNTPGPRNLNLNVIDDSRDVAPKASEEEDKPNVGDAIRKFGVEDAWDIDTGEGAVAAIFDTSFCKDRFQDDRIIDTFSPEGTDSAFSAPKEGHGTMTAYSMAGNSRGHDISYNGVAKDADLLLARVSSKDGALSAVNEAWDWLVNHIKKSDKPIISNHSYGVPLCSAKTMNTCDSTTTKIAKVANQRSDHQGFYAAGNEALYCGHRLGGLTNGINGINSHPTSITSAAFRYDLNDAQNYSSHGFGTCASANNNPKPDFGCLLPDIVPYGCEEKDMSMGQGGSGGGTSEASPLNAGVATIIASVTGNAERDVIEGIMEETATQVRPSQINVFRGHDGRFGKGQVRAGEAVKQALDSLPDEAVNNMG